MRAKTLVKSTPVFRALAGFLTLLTLNIDLEIEKKRKKAQKNS